MQYMKNNEATTTARNVKVDAHISFSGAITALKLGKKVTRSFWADDVYLYLSEGSTINFDELRQDAQNNSRGLINGISTDCIEISPHIDMKSAADVIIIGWSPSQLDMLAEDWIIVE